MKVVSFMLNTLEVLGLYGFLYGRKEVVKLKRLNLITGTCRSYSMLDILRTIEWLIKIIGKISRGKEMW
jgi:hypothetical protein